MTNMVPCPHCTDGFNGPTRTNTAVCRTCAGTHMVPARTGETPEASYRPEPTPFRVGHRVPRHVYEGDTPLFTAATPELAARLVRLLNAGSAVS